MRALLLLALALLAPAARGHSFLTRPPAFNDKFRTRFCSGAECTAACPTEFNAGMANSAESPAATWRRGSNVTVAWARNNHRGGVVSLALVPLGRMDSRETHAQLAFLYGCWSSGAHPCTGAACGTDRDRVAFARSVRVPTVFPDGRYVLGLAWYGGLRPPGGGFQDFYSCAHVRVEGGPLGGSLVAPFEPGADPPKDEDIRDGKCLATADAPGVCGHAGCESAPARYLVPRTVRLATQDPITPAVVRPMLAEPHPGFEHGTVPEAARDRSGAPGVCSGRVCCAASCGACGGRGCNQRSGGAEACCARRVVQSGRVCGDTVPPPCVMRWKK